MFVVVCLDCKDTKIKINGVGGEWLKNTKKPVNVYVPEA